MRSNSPPKSFYFITVPFHSHIFLSLLLSPFTLTFPFHFPLALFAGVADEAVGAPWADVDLAEAADSGQDVAKAFEVR